MPRTETFELPNIPPTKGVGALMWERKKAIDEAQTPQQKRAIRKVFKGLIRRAR